jgi:sec-independent protein translocase protein TatB
MLPGIGFQELFFIGIIALVVVGPKDLPLMMRKLGQIVAKGRALAGEFRAAFDDIARQAELDELRQEIEDLKNANAVKEATDEMRDFEREVNDRVMREQAEDAALAKPTSAPIDKPDTSSEVS